MVNVLGLTVELKTAGVQFSGCNSLGVVWGPDGSEIQTRPDVAAIITTHNKASWDAKEAQWIVTQNAARVAAKSLANGWASMTQAEFLDWWTARLAPGIINALSIPQGAKDVLNALATAALREGQIDIAMRDWIWNNLADV